MGRMSLSPPTLSLDGGGAGGAEPPAELDSASADDDFALVMAWVLIFAKTSLQSHISLPSRLCARKKLAHLA